MENQIVDDFGIVTTTFFTSFERAFLYLSNPQNLPEWTLLFKEASDSHAILETPYGLQTFGLLTNTSFEQGVIDWYILSDHGRQVDQSCSRLYRLSYSRCVYSFMFFVNPLPDENQKSALKRQTRLIEKELARLQELFGGE